MKSAKIRILISIATAVTAAKNAASVILSKSPPNKLKPETVVGEIYGNLLVLDTAPSPKKWGTSWLCFCTQCENTCTVPTGHLRNGHTRSCGCRRRMTHGLSKTPEYKIWTAIHQRCSNPNFDDYHNYGGRGIRVCKRWDSFDVFIVDMGMRPSKKFSIERIDCNGPYSPENCKWATRIEQMANRRDTLYLTVDDVSKPLTEWCREYKIKDSVVRQRLRSNWSPITALTTPVGRIGVTLHRWPRRQ